MFIKRFASILCAAALLSALLFGCKPAANEADTAAVNAALDKLVACTNLTMIQSTIYEETVTDGTETYIYSGSNIIEITLITSPTPKLHTATTIQVSHDGEVVEQSTISYVLPEDGGYTEYYHDGESWYKITSDDPDALSGITAADMASMFLTSGLAYGKVGTETLSGGTADRYEVELKGEKLVNLLEANGQLSNIYSMSESLQTRIKENLAADLPPVTVSVWVDAASGYPVQFELSITEILDDFQASIAKTLGEKDSDSQWAVTRYEMFMAVSNFDSVEDIILPAEAADAQPYVTEESGETT